LQHLPSGAGFGLHDARRAATQDLRQRNPAHRQERAKRF